MKKFVLLAGLLALANSANPKIVVVRRGGSAAAPPASILFVQASNGEHTTSASSTATAATASTTGNLIHVAVRISLTGSCPTITVADTASNTYTQIGTTTSNTNACLAQFYAKNITGNAANVVTASFSAADTFSSVITQEFSGLSTTAPLDTQAVGSSASATLITSASFTTAAAAEVIVAGAQMSNTGNTFTPDTGYIKPTNGQNATAYAAVEYKIVSSIQTSVTTTMTFSTTGPCAINVATFKQ